MMHVRARCTDTIVALGIGLGLAVSLVTGAPPRVASTTPESGDTRVDPALAELRVEFDRDMRIGVLHAAAAEVMRRSGKGKAARAYLVESLVEAQAGEALLFERTQSTAAEVWAGR